MKGFSEFIGESHRDQALPVLQELEESRDRDSTVIDWFKENLKVDNISRIIEHSKESPFYSIMSKKHGRFNPMKSPWSRLTFRSMRLEWFKDRKYAVLIDIESREPLCFWISKEDERLFYSDNIIVDRLFKDF